MPTSIDVGTRETLEFVGVRVATSEPRDRTSDPLARWRLEHQEDPARAIGMRLIARRP